MLLSARLAMPLTTSVHDETHREELVTRRGARVFRDMAAILLVVLWCESIQQTSVFSAMTMWVQFQYSISINRSKDYCTMRSILLCFHGMYVGVATTLWTLWTACGDLITCVHPAWFDWLWCAVIKDFIISLADLTPVIRAHRGG